MTSYHCVKKDQLDDDSVYGAVCTLKPDEPSFGPTTAVTFVLVRTLILNVEA